MTQNVPSFVVESHHPRRPGSFVPPADRPHGSKRHQGKGAGQKKDKKK